MALFPEPVQKCSQNSKSVTSMASSFCTSLHLQGSNRDTSHGLSTAFLVRVTNIHCVSAFLNTIINGMLVMYSIPQNHTHCRNSLRVVLDSSLPSSEHISRLVFPVSSTTNALMSVPVLFVSSLPLGTRPQPIFMNIFFWIFSRVTFYKISQYCQTQRYKAESPFTKSANNARLSTAKQMASSVAQQQQCCSPHNNKSSNNPLYITQYAASWGCNLCGVQILPESIKQS